MTRSDTRLKRTGGFALLLVATALLGTGNAQLDVPKEMAGIVKAGKKNAVCNMTTVAKAMQTTELPKTRTTEVGDKIETCDQKYDDKVQKIVDEIATEDPMAAADAENLAEGVRRTASKALDGVYRVAQATAQFTDNGDGTVTDNVNDLQWETKNGDDSVANPANPNDVDNTYSLSAGGDLPTGTAYTNFLKNLNGGLGNCFAGYCDWRLPTRSELRDLIKDGQVCSIATPCIDPALEPVASTGYWSSTNDQDSVRSEVISFVSNDPQEPVGKVVLGAVRAVRQAPRARPLHCGTTNKCAFVTSKVSTANLGGLAGADATCNTLADAAEMPGTYVAWLSDAATSATSRIASNGPYAVRSGNLVANDLADLVDGPIAPIDEDEWGAKTLVREVWTHTDATGSSYGASPFVNSPCSNWTDGSNGGGWATVGVNTFAAGQWTDVYFQFCDRNISLYCIQQ